MGSELQLLKVHISSEKTESPVCLVLQLVMYGLNLQAALSVKRYLIGHLVSWKYTPMK